MGIITGGRLIEGSGLGSPILNAGAPVNNETSLGVAVVGSKLTDTTNGAAYICTATNGDDEITWTLIGEQAS